MANPLRGEPKAIGAIRHYILVAYYHIVRDQVPFRELGPGWQRKRYSAEHRARRLQRQLDALGDKITVEANEELRPAS
jgi:transposase